jgi:hypothetical protein
MMPLYHRDLACVVIVSLKPWEWYLYMLIETNPTGAYFYPKITIANYSFISSEMVFISILYHLIIHVQMLSSY